MMIAPFNRITVVSVWKSDDGKHLYKAMAFSGQTGIGQMVIMERKNEIRMMGLTVEVSQRRKRVATAMMNWLITESQFTHKPMYIEVDSYQSVSNLNDPRPTDDVLSKFYQKFGFIGVQGHPFAMVRFPVAKTPVYANN